MKKQGYNARKDEQLGMTRGKQSGKKMSMAGRRKVAKATRKPKGTYGFKKKQIINRGSFSADRCITKAHSIKNT